MVMHHILIPMLKKMSRLPFKVKTKKLKISHDIKERRVDFFLPLKIEGEFAHPEYKHPGAVSNTAKYDGYAILKRNQTINE